MSLLKRTPKPLWIALLLAIGLLAFAACGDDDEDDDDGPAATPTPSTVETPELTPTPPAGESVGVSLVEFEVIPAQDTAAAGTVTFTVSNDGVTIHNFRAIKTDLAPDALPKTDSTVDEDQVVIVAAIPDFSGGETQEVTVNDLEPGSYVLICNITGHYDLGMRSAFTVQ